MSPTAAPTAGPRWKESTKDQRCVYVAASLGWTRDAFGALVVFILALVVGPEIKGKRLAADLELSNGGITA